MCDYSTLIKKADDIFPISRDSGVETLYDRFVTSDLIGWHIIFGSGIISSRIRQVVAVHT